MKDHYKLIINESESIEGILVQLRTGNEPSSDRVKALNEALEKLSEEAEDWESIEIRLASALHALSFHLCGLVEAWKTNKKEFESKELDDLFVSIYIHIDTIFQT